MTGKQNVIEMEEFIGGFTLMEWRQAQRDTETERDRQTETETKRDRQPERETDRQTKRETEREKYSWQRDKYVQGERER